MEVRTAYYIYFWFINSIMAFGTGIIMGLVGMRVFTIMFNAIYDATTISLLIILITPLCFLSGYQFFLLSFFWGKRRGEFEYSFLEKSAQGNKELFAQLKRVNQELKCGDQNSAHVKLLEATKIWPNNFVFQFRYAISCERIGKAEDAIAAYEKALDLISSSSGALITYVSNQINRVKTKGPHKGAATPGLKYVLY